MKLSARGLQTPSVGSTGQNMSVRIGKALFKAKISIFHLTTDQECFSHKVHPGARVRIAEVSD